jgi:hypothetical protein
MTVDEAVRLLQDVRQAGFAFGESLKENYPQIGQATGNNLEYVLEAFTTEARRGYNVTSKLPPPPATGKGDSG